MLREGHKAVVLDLDGTITDPEKTTRAFADGYTKSLSKNTGIVYAELHGELEKQMQKILAHPEEYHFSFDGFIVSSANDPYFLVQTAGSQALDKFFRFSSEQKAQLGFQGFLESYPNVPVYFREEAKEALKELQALDKTTVVNVTNSSTKRAERIFQKLLGENHKVIVWGDAQKIHINPQWRRRGMPAQVHIFESQIPALLQRQMYFKALFAICGGDFRRIDSVWGDNGRLDLILPQHLKGRGQQKGIFTGLITSSITNPLEEQYFREGDNSTTITSLSDITEKVRKRRMQ